MLRKLFWIMSWMAGLSGTALGWLRPVASSTPQELALTQNVQYTFGRALTFQATIQSNAAIESIQVVFSDQSAAPLKGEMTHTPDGSWSYTHDLARAPLQAFATITYTFQARLPGGTSETSPAYFFVYDDNRIAWYTLQAAPLEIYWQDDDQAFGQEIMELAQESLGRIDLTLGAKPSKPIKIYAYASAAEMQATLRMGNVKWVAGHADPELGVVVVALPTGPERRILMEQRIPHELTHILLYEWLGQGYYQLPVWLNEGLASVSEFQPNPDYALVLQRALEEDSFIPMKSLCSGFPTDDMRAFQAYAQSEWFVRYLNDHFGGQAVQALAEAYADGMDCDSGARAVLGESLEAVERRWLSEVFGKNFLLEGLAAFLPWGAFAGLFISLPFLVMAISPKKARLAQKARA